MNSPFILENHTEYKEWRDLKLLNYPVQKNKLIFKFDKNIVDEKVLNLFKSTINDYNFVIYEFGSEVLDAELLNFCSALGLTNSVSNLFSDEDNISNITNQEEEKQTSKGEYIPYTNKQLNWHTDGYYYPINSAIKSFLLHCVYPAKEGGENLLMDHEIIYIHIRDHNPDFIDVLMQNNIMEIPNNKNLKESKNISGPVFYVDEKKFLNMRFTSRQKNIIWKKNDMIKKIKKFMYEFINEDEKYLFKLQLKKNQGYIANNVLHKRENYIDGDKKRLLKRLRFSNRLG
tara:strand:+ start:1786 stop:2646 length:861 start_codon:yes stop_codon:yes gene_type:complete